MKVCYYYDGYSEFLSLFRQPPIISTVFLCDWIHIGYRGIYGGIIGGILI